MKNCCTKTRVVIENRQHVSHGLARVNAIGQKGLLANGR